MLIYTRLVIEIYAHLNNLKVHVSSGSVHDYQQHPSSEKKLQVLCGGFFKLITALQKQGYALVCLRVTRVIFPTFQPARWLQAFVFYGEILWSCKCIVVTMKHYVVLLHGCTWLMSKYKSSNCQEGKKVSSLPEGVLVMQHPWRLVY